MEWDSGMKLSGWGKYPQIETEAVQCFRKKDVADRLSRNGHWISHGLGRSYGDSALARQVLLTRYMNRCLLFDMQAGRIICEAGLSLAKIIEIIVPRGWFLPVTPGTKQVTVGGAIAGDVHGKNHHVDGCFSAWVENFELMLPGGETKLCSAHKNRRLFLATCGGMGLTGVILRAEFRLRRVESSAISGRTVPARNLAEIFDCFEAYAHWHYLVAWIDCLAGGNRAGRSILIAGEHALRGSLQYQKRKTVSIPEQFPAIALNWGTAKCFNTFYYVLNNLKKRNFISSMEHFFYPLDGLADWNRLYGATGLLQYQLVLPKPAGEKGLSRILEMVRKSGEVPFLGVLKLMGSENENFLTFPQKGYTLALDFKSTPGLFLLLNELDRVVADHGGRIYLAKDARMGAEMMSGYPRLSDFKDVRKQYHCTEFFQSLQSRRLEL